MSGGQLAALVSAITGLVTAITTLLALLGHLRNHDQAAGGSSTPAKDGQSAGKP